MKSNAKDMVKYLQIQLSDTTFYAPLHHPTVKANHKSGVGLGWHYGLMAQDTVWAHSGGTGGFTTNICFNKPQNKGVVVLSNVSAFSKSSTEVNKLCFRLLLGL